MMATVSKPGQNAELIKAEDEFAAAARQFNGDPISQMKLLKGADNLRYLLESPPDRMMKQWEHVSEMQVGTY